MKMMMTINVPLARFLSPLITLISVIMASSCWADHQEREAYHILQKGYIQIEGSTNLFKFTGESTRFNGKLEKDDSGFYTGQVILRLDQISFRIPAVASVIKDPEFFDAESYPTINIKLNQFDPRRKSSVIKGNLNLRGVEKAIRIHAEMLDLSPIIQTIGRFNIKQSDFNIPLYKSGILEIEDSLTIRFHLFFCEGYGRNPDKTICM